ncbi:MAG: DsbA family oxidoreductase [Pyrinomonadaceae bacterium MAG19_C2-C3]|nr:DsbA family oxidoreductase [Pyrinomonadaceae bacterium MAG19_C2-C3]
MNDKNNGENQTKVVRLEVFSDYVCPFCWLTEPALRELRRLEPDVEIVWRAYELRPEPKPTLNPGGEYLTRVWRDGVYPLAERLGVTMRLPPVQPRSRLAHEAAKWAQSVGRFDDYNAALFRAFFERGEDIGATEILIRLAADLELDAASLRRALDTRMFELSVITDEQEAAALGMSGVPAFVANRRAALSGVQSVEAFQGLINRVREIMNAT